MSDDGSDNSGEPEVTEEEVARAIQNTGIKATGVDKLEAKRLKDP